MRGASAGRPFLKPIFSHSRKLFSKFPHKIFVIIYVISLAWKISYCLSANHSPELRCVICTGVTLFALVLHLNCTALSQSESSNFFTYVIIRVTYGTDWFIFSTVTIKYINQDAGTLLRCFMNPGWIQTLLFFIV